MVAVCDGALKAGCDDFVNQLLAILLYPIDETQRLRLLNPDHNINQFEENLLASLDASITMSKLTSDIGLLLKRDGFYLNLLYEILEFSALFSSDAIIEKLKTEVIRCKGQHDMTHRTEPIAV